MQQTDLESAVGRQSWDWLVDLAPRLNIIVEMIDGHDVPVFPVGSTQEAVAFRALITTGEPAIRSAVSDVLHSKKPVFVSVDGVQAVCCGLNAEAVLLVARHVTTADSVEECRQDLESIGHWLTGAIEASLAPTSAMSVEPYRIVSFRRILREATSRGSMRKVVGAFIEALSVWDDVRVRCYIAGAAGGFLQYGAPLETAPSPVDQLDEAIVPPHGRIVRLSRTDIDRLRLVSEPGDTLMLRILVRDIAWLLVFSGMIDDREQVRLRVYCDILRESLHDVATMITGRVVADVSRPERPVNEPAGERAQTALDQLMGAVGAIKGALDLTDADGRNALAVGDAELLASPGAAARHRLVVTSSDADSVMTAVFEREQAPFTAFERDLALAGMAVVHRRMHGGLQRSNDGERRRQFRPVDSVFDQLATDAVATGRQASVIVVSVDEAAGRAGVLSSWVGKVRGQLRAGDFAGVLSEREIAVLLCGASAEHAAVVAARLMRMFKSNDPTGAFLHSVVGTTTRSPNSWFEGSIVGAARARAARR